MKTVIEMDLKEGLYNLIVEWPEIGISQPMTFVSKLGAYRMEELERLCRSDKLNREKEMTDILFRDALWAVQAYMFKTIQKEKL